MDQYLTNRPEASARVFRVYRPTPPHYHATCDEYLYVFSGRGTFWMGDPATKAEFRPGQLLFFQKGTIHAMPDLLEEPIVFLSVDTPRRDPKDIIFVNPEDGTPETFIVRIIDWSRAWNGYPTRSTLFWVPPATLGHSVPPHEAGGPPVRLPLEYRPASP